MTEVKVGLIGFGLAGSVFHAPLILSEPRMALTAVASSKPLAPELGNATLFTDPYEMIASDQVDLVVIATPNEAHVSLATAALNAGKHVVVDKPFTIELEDARRLAKLAAEKNRLLTVFHNRRWDGSFLTVRELLNQNAVGRVNLCEIHYDRFRPTAKPGWREAEALGSGVLYDLGPHVIDQALCLFGMPDTVIADVTAQRDNVVADDYFHLQLNYGKSLRVILHASCIVFHEGPRVEVHGDTGSILQMGLDGQEADLVAGKRPGDAAWGQAADVAVKIVDATGSRDIAVKPGAYENFYRTIAATIVDGATPAITSEQAVNVMKVLDAACRSANEGRRIQLT